MKYLPFHVMIIAVYDYSSIFNKNHNRKGDQMPGINKKRNKTTYGIQQLNQWDTIVKEHFPELSKPQATVLAMWSFGMAIVKSCALTTVMLFLAKLLKVKENTMRQRLKLTLHGAMKARERRGKSVLTSRFILASPS
jgi:hypothetical protein